MNSLSSDDDQSNTALPCEEEGHVRRVDAMAAGMIALFSESDDEHGTYAGGPALCQSGTTRVCDGRP